MRCDPLAHLLGKFRAKETRKYWPSKATLWALLLLGVITKGWKRRVSVTLRGPRTTWLHKRWLGLAVQIDVLAKKTFGRSVLWGPCSCTFLLFSSVFCHCSLVFSGSNLLILFSYHRLQKVRPLQHLVTLSSCLCWPTEFSKHGIDLRTFIMLDGTAAAYQWHRN